MKSICFVLGNLTCRGTTVATLDYARFNKKILNNESIIAFSSSLLEGEEEVNTIKKNDIIKRMEAEFDIIVYDSDENLVEELNKRNCEYIYLQKAGFIDEHIFTGKKLLVHGVFNYYQPHGYKYVYVSEWLAEIASNKECGWVPHIVDLPKSSTKNYREYLNIPKDKIVIGRHGGYDQFDIGFVHNVINYIVNNDDDFIFVFVNTRPFINHPNVLFLDSIIDTQDKTNFILSCDAMIHARSDGESFGLAICEFLFHNKPTISFAGGRDKNNVILLDQYGLLYNTEYELLQNIFKLKFGKYTHQYSDIVKEFTPEKVMDKFNSVFLSK